MGNAGKHIIRIIAGPTASGKSARAMALAHALDGVVINCDSMQIYDALPVLSAQPSVEDLEQVPHKLYGFLHPSEDCSAGRWRRMAQPIIEETLAQGKAPIICGGTGFYIKALSEGLSPIPEVPDEVRFKGEALMSEMGCPAFYEALIAEDPLVRDKFHPNHTARILRAWEVFHATGKSLIEWQALDKIGPPEDWTFETEIILPERDVLYQRCNQRFDAMVAYGVMDEVKALDAMINAGEVRDGSLITNALGFKPLRDYMYDRCTLDEAIAQSKQDTRNYAKRQSTWFRNQL